MDYDVPPPGYIPPKRHRAPQENNRLTVTEVVRTAAKLGNGYNRAQSLHALAAIAQEIRKLILE
jgi:hypothetical protein